MNQGWTNNGCGEDGNAPAPVPMFLKGGDLRLLLFGGKGGVGKTTCAAAAALSLAGRFPERRYLIASTDPAHSLCDSLAGSPLPPNLELIEIDAPEKLREFKQAHAEHLRTIGLRGTFLDADDVDQLLDLSMPGLDEVMAFNEISALVQARAYSCIIVDTAPTGHTLRFLGLPRILRNWIEALDAMLAKHRYMLKLHRRFYRKEETDLFLEELAASIECLASLLSDTPRCRFVPVTLAEPLVREETVRLVRDLKRMRIPVREILVNRVYPARTDCPTCREVRRGQDDELRRIGEEFPGYLLWSIPLQGPEVRGTEQLARFWDHSRMIDRSAVHASGMASPGPDYPQHDTSSGTTLTLSPEVEYPARLPDAEMCLVLFAGKGGVGKTTLASATALRLAQEHENREVLLFSTDPAHSLSDCLGIAIGPREVRIRPRLTAMEINAEAEFQELKRQYADEVEELFGSVTGGTMVDLSFDREVIERIMDLSPPGLDEIMALTRAMELLEAGRYDLFVLDTAPTGHLIRLLELPGLIQDWLKVLFGLFLKYKEVFRLPKVSDLMVTMSKRLKTLRSLLADSRKGGLYAVTTPTEMAFEETCDLLAACRQMGIHVPGLFVNLATSPGGCSLCNVLAQKESTVRKKLEHTFKRVRQTVVYRCGQPRGVDRLSELGKALYPEPSRVLRTLVVK